MPEDIRPVISQTESELTPQEKVERALGRESNWTPEVSTMLSHVYDSISQREPIKTKLEKILQDADEPSTTVVRALVQLFIFDALLQNRDFDIHTLADTLLFNGEPDSKFYEGVSDQQKTEIKAALLAQQIELINSVIPAVDAAIRARFDYLLNPS